MTASDEHKEDFPRDEVIAAEYVVGVLSAADRRHVEKRMLLDENFSHLVRNWEEHFSRLNNAYEPVAPNAAVFAEVEKRLFGSSVTDVSPGFWGSLVFWRGMTALTTALAIGGIFFATFTPQLSPPRMSYMAELSSPDAPMAVMVAYDAQSGRMVLTPMAGGEKEQKSLELWLVYADGTPRSLGVFDPSKDAEMVIPVEMRDQLRDGITLAVSLEPYGGSPTGKPTGPVLASGTTRQL